MHALYDPAVFAKATAAFNASARNTADDSPTLEVLAAARVVVTLISMQLGRSATRSATQSFDGGYRIQTLLEHHGVMSVSSAGQHSQRNATSIYDDVSFGAELASVGRVGPCFLAPGGLGPTSHQCLPAANRSGRTHANAPVLRDEGAPKHRPLATLAAVSSTSCHYHSPAPVADPPRGFLSPKQTAFLGMTLRR